MQPHERVRIQPMAAGPVPAIDQGDAHHRMTGQRVSESHARRPGSDDQIVGLERTCHGVIQASSTFDRIFTAPVACTRFAPFRVGGRPQPILGPLYHASPAPPCSRKLPDSRPVAGGARSNFLTEYRDAWDSYEMEVKKLIPVNDDRVLVHLSLRAEGRESGVKLEGDLYQCV